MNEEEEENWDNDDGVNDAINKLKSSSLFKQTNEDNWDDEDGNRDRRFKKSFDHEDNRKANRNSLNNHRGRWDEGFEKFNRNCHKEAGKRYGEDSRKPRKQDDEESWDEEIIKPTRKSSNYNEKMKQRNDDEENWDEDNEPEELLSNKRKPQTNDEENWDEEPTKIPRNKTNPQPNNDDENWDEECDQEIKSYDAKTEWNDAKKSSSPSNFSRKVLTTPSPVEEERPDRFGRDRQSSFNNFKSNGHTNKRHKTTTSRHWDEPQESETMFVDRSKAYEKGSFYIQTPNDFGY